MDTMRKSLTALKATTGEYVSPLPSIKSPRKQISLGYWHVIIPINKYPSRYCFYSESNGSFHPQPKVIAWHCCQDDCSLSKGIIVKKASSLQLDCFCDADFADLYSRDPYTSLSSAKSSGAYIIKLSGCPLIWKSQLMPNICLTTAESEYYALSQSMRVLLPIRSTLIEMINNISFPSQLKVFINQITTTTHEDNTSALTLANDQRITSRTRHYQVSWHFFWQAVCQGNVKVAYIDTKNQEADYLTKGLPLDTFL